MYYLRGPKLVVLAGPTGSGKTAVLEALHKKGFSIINLEGLARHKGSVFGAIGASQPQPSQPEFEEALEALYQAHNSSPIIYTEQEAPAIGKRRIPDWFYEKMQEGVFVFLDLSKPERIKLITAEYGHLDKNAFCGAIDKLSERLPAERREELKTLVLNDRFPDFVELMLDYYDAGYHYSTNKKEDTIRLRFIEFDAAVIAQEVADAVQRFISSSICQEPQDRES
jgi:tRNA 2-selenouridine synthase